MIPGIYNNIQINAAGMVVGGGTLAYPSEIATGAEVDTGTDDEKYVTALAIEDSSYVKAAYVTSAISGKLDSNTPITGATKTKITYDADGLVTVGADATTADIADSTDKRYLTEVEKSSIDSQGQLNFFDLSGTDVVISSASDGSANMVKVNIATAISNNTNFDNGGADDGRIRYTGTPTVKFTVVATLGFSAGTGADSFVFCLAKSGVTDNITRNIYTSRTVSDLDSITISGIVELATNGYIEIYVGNMTAARDIKCKTLNLTING
jgi:hypothetical protein